MIIKILRHIVEAYDAKHPSTCKPYHICTSIDTRNRSKNDAYKIPADQPQCPVFKDNRCCGGCKLATSCEHCVNCNCYGFAYGQMGGTDKDYYLRKASEYYGLGRVKTENGKQVFDWEYFKFNKKKVELKKGLFIVIVGQAYEITKEPDKKGYYEARSCIYDTHIRDNIRNLPDYVIVYDNKDTAMYWAVH